MYNIRVICPSNSFKKSETLTIKRITNKLKKDGYNVTLGKNVFKKEKYYECANIKNRLYDLEEALNDNTIDIIICGKGGFNSNQLLPFIKNNYKNKKIIGMSDNTTLMVALFKYLDTYIGPNFINLDNEETYNYFIEILKNKEYNIKVKKENIIRMGIVNGTIIGGNLCTLNLLQGTKFINKVEDVILFIEDDDNYKEGTFFKEFDRNLESLLQTNLFNIKCILFGKFEKSTKIEKNMLLKMVKNKLKTIPIYWNIDFGHIPPIITLPLGKKCFINKNKIIIKDKN